MKDIQTRQTGILQQTNVTNVLRKKFADYSFKKPFFLTSILYVVAALCQCIWFYILNLNFDQVLRWIKLPVMGWVMAFIFIAMAVIIPLMFIIGIKLFILIYKADGIRVTQADVSKRRTVNLLLGVGILADVVFSYVLLSSDIQDKSAIVFACALFGGKILQANYEAVALYFSVRKTN